MSLKHRLTNPYENIGYTRKRGTSKALDQLTQYQVQNVDMMLSAMNRPATASNGKIIKYDSFTSRILTRLKENLSRKDTRSVVRAISNLDNKCSNPRQANHILSLGFTQKCAELLHCREDVIREKAVSCLRKLYVFDNVKGSVMDEIVLLRLKEMINDSNKNVRIEIARFLEKLSQLYSHDMVNLKFIPEIIRAINEDHNIIRHHLKTFRFLLNRSNKNDIISNWKIWRIFLKLLENENPAILIDALDCISELVTIPVGKCLACEEKLLNKVIILLNHNDQNIHMRAAKIIMLATTGGLIKFRFRKTSALLRRLVEMCNSSFFYAKLFAIKALITICTHSVKSRKFVCENYLRDLQNVSPRKDQLLMLHKKARSSGINPRVINRSVARARDEIVIDGTDFEPPYLRISSHLPYTPIENVDITRRPCAFGRWALPKLRRELHSKDVDLQVAAITTICDLCRDSEKAFEAIRLRIPNRLADLLLNANEVIRERSLYALIIIANQADGKTAITNNQVTLRNILELITSETNDLVRLKATELVYVISEFWITGCTLVESGFLSYLIDGIESETDEIIIMRLKAVYHLMTTANCISEVMELDGFGTCLDLLERDNKDIQSNSLKCLQILTSCPLGQELFLEHKLLYKLNKLLRHKNSDVYTCAASLLMFGTVHTKVKIKCKKFVNLPGRLLELCYDRFTPYVQFFAIKALTNICEFPPIRKRVRDNHMDIVNDIITDGDEDLKQHKEILIKILKKMPDVFDEDDIVPTYYNINY